MTNNKKLNFNVQKKLLFGHDIILKQNFFEPKQWVIPIEEQIKFLQKNLIGIKVDLEYVNKKTNEQIPNGFARVAIPKMSYFGQINNIDPYLEIGILVEQVCYLLSKQRIEKFTHYRKGQLGPVHIRCDRELVEKRKKLEVSVSGDILILDVNLGSMYAGWTPRRARENIIANQNQLALSCVDLGWVLLINPKRFQHCDDLSVDSVAEEYFSEDRKWECVLFFYFRGGKLEFGYRWGRRSYFDSGAAIGILNSEEIVI